MNADPLKLVSQGGLRENIPGMLTEAEAAKLTELARDKYVLELGSYTGLSTITMARVAKCVVSCDWHFGDEHIGKRDTLAELDANLRKYGVRDKVILLVGRFDETLRLLQSDLFDMAFIDGAHDYHSVMMDTCHAARLVKQRAHTAAWHDIDQADVRRLYEEIKNIIAARNVIASGEVERLGWVTV